MSDCEESGKPGEIWQMVLGTDTNREHLIKTL